MTMRELARLANVSVSTVSKAFCDAEDVSEETKQHIFSIARQTGCYGKFYKGKYSKKIIAVICPELYSSYYAEYVEVLQRILEENNCIVLISSYHFDDKTQAELLEYYCSYLQVDGIIVLNLKTPLKKGYNVPIVSMFDTTDETVDVIKVDDYTPMTEAVELLKSLGHRHFAFIGEKLTSAREHFFVELMQKSGMEYCTVKSDYRFEKAGEDGIKQLLEQRRDFTAVFCAYDNIAIGAVKQLKKEGLRVPEDCSVVGVNNIDTSEYMETSLTTIDSNTEETCLAAWGLLEKKLKNRFYRSGEKTVIKGRLIVRDTVAKAKI